MTRKELFDAIILWMKHYPKQKDKILRPQTFAVLRQFRQDLHADNLNKTIEDINKSYYWNRNLNSGNYGVEKIVKEIPIITIFEKGSKVKIKNNMVFETVSFEIASLFSHNKHCKDYAYKYVINDYYVLSRRFLYQLIYYITKLKKYAKNDTSMHCTSLIHNNYYNDYDEVTSESNILRNHIISLLNNREFNAVPFEDDRHNLYGSIMDFNYIFTTCLNNIEVTDKFTNSLYIKGC